MRTFLRHLSDLADWRLSKVKILATSCPVPSAEYALRGTRLLNSRPDGKHADRDIDAYICKSLQSSTFSPDLHETVKMAVLSKAQGLFLFAKIAVDAVLESNNDVRSALDRILDNLHLLYTRLLADHASKHNIEMGQ